VNCKCQSLTLLCTTSKPNTLYNQLILLFRLILGFTHTIMSLKCPYCSLGCKSQAGLSQHLRQSDKCPYARHVQKHGGTHADYMLMQQTDESRSSSNAAAGGEEELPAWPFCSHSCRFVTAHFKRSSLATPKTPQSHIFIANGMMQESKKPSSSWYQSSDGSLSARPLR
jgi:endogenous inhibitor of DNA gyrase (YacG/DUF329 family)